MFYSTATGDGTIVASRNLGFCTTLKKGVRGQREVVANSVRRYGQMGRKRCLILTGKKLFRHLSGSAVLDITFSSQTYVLFSGC